jgi:hypothetical protein
VKLIGLLQALVQHTSSYTGLVCDAAGEYRSRFVRRVVLLVSAVVLGVVGLVAAWAAGLIAVWDSAFRMYYAVGSALVALIVSGLLVSMVIKAPVPGPRVSRLKRELAMDAQLFHDWKNSL